MSQPTPPDAGVYRDAFADVRKPGGQAIWYLITALLVTCAMVVLPLLYMSLVVFMGYGVVYHIVHNAGPMLGQGSGLVMLLLYLLPIFLGSVLILFMLKPLLSTAPDDVDVPTLSWEEEGRLFAFVQALCQHLGAPMPTGLVVDCSVNAFANFRRGKGLSRELHLHIGLPLVAGLNVQQFAGVLAHEFGHFNQSFGVRLSAIVQAINLWFARVVFERDGWDQILDAYAEEHPWMLVRGLARLARLCVQLSRGVLWLLMMIGHATSALMLREMELDADRYAAHVSGSDSFQTTLHETQKMMLAAELVLGTLQDQWSEGRLCNNIPMLIAAKAADMPEEFEDIMKEQLNEEQTMWYDSHPASSVRMRVVAALEAPGVLRLEGPATQLFVDFPKLAKAESLYLYKQMFGEVVADGSLAGVDEVMGLELLAQAEHDAGVRVWRHLLVAVCPIPAAEVSLDAPFVPADMAEQLQTMRDLALAEESHSLKVLKHFLREREGLSAALRMRELLQCEIPLDPKDFGVEEATLAAAQQKSHSHRRACELALESLDPFASLQAQRFSLALSFWRASLEPGTPPMTSEEPSPTTAPSLPLEDQPAPERLPVEDAADVVPLGDDVRDAWEGPLELLDQESPLAVSYTLAEVEGLLDAMTALYDERDNIQELLEHFDLLQWYLHIHQTIDELPDSLTMLSLGLVKRVADDLGTMRNRLRRVPYPFSHAQGDCSLGQYLVASLPTPDEPVETLQGMEQTVRGLIRLYARAWGALSRIVEGVERHFGLAPVVVPDDPFLDQLLEDIEG